MCFLTNSTLENNRFTLIELDKSCEYVQSRITWRRIDKLRATSKTTKFIIKI